MADFTLIDVENGMYDLSLHTVLTPPCFAFFWGIIQTCNRFKPRFKNPFTLTVAQAQAAGGGQSRQAVWDKQQRLNKIEIDGRRLITITPGSKKNNLAAKYKINYNLLIPPKVDIPEFTKTPSNIIDDLLTKSGRSADDLLTFLRSEEKREEQIPPSPKNGTTISVEGKEGLADVDDFSQKDSGRKSMLDGYIEEQNRVKEIDDRAAPTKSSQDMPQNTVTQPKRPGHIDDGGNGKWIPPEDSEEDWITYVVDILKKPGDKFPPIDLQEKAIWLVKNNDLELLEECYDVFQQIPLAKVSGSRVNYFMGIIRKRGGEVIK